MSNENTQPNTKGLLLQDKTLVSTQQKSELRNFHVKPSQLFANPDDPANNIIISNVPKIVSNIFGSKNQPTQNIFNNNNTQKTVNLFSISTVPQTNGNANIFKSGAKPIIASQEDQDDKSLSNASSEGVKKAQSDFRTVPEKLEMKFNYEKTWKVIKTFNLKKFKNGLNASKEHIYLTLEQNYEFPDRVYIFVRAKETKVILFQGFGLKNLSDKMSNFMNRQENLKFSVVKQQKVQENEEQKQKFVREELKIQFQSVADMKEFREFMSKEFGQKKQGGQV